MQISYFTKIDFMKVTAVLLFLFPCFLSLSGQENTPRTVGVIYELSDSIHQYHVGFTIFENFEKVYPQNKGTNKMIEEMLNREIRYITGLKVYKLDYSFKEIDHMIKTNATDPISAYDIIMVILDEGVTTSSGYIVNTHKGRGIFTNFTRGITIYANLGVELINTSTNKRVIYDLKNNVLSSEGVNRAVFRYKKKFLESGESKKEISDDKLTEIQNNLLEMYQMQAKKAFDPYVLSKMVSELFKQ